MITHLLSRNKIKQFSKFSADFSDQTKFSELIQEPFSSIEQLYNQISRKSAAFSSENRAVLVQELKSQLGNFSSEAQQRNLDLLAQENTFTITTGHQLTLFAGPLYFVYKALHAAKLAREFNQKHSDYQLVPVFWLATEDHDLDEVRHAHLFGRKLSWETAQTGAVGQMKVDDFSDVWNEFKKLFEGKETEIANLLNQTPCGKYQYFMQRWVSELFAHFGILVIQPNTKALKSLFAPIMWEELFGGRAFEAVNTTNEKILKLGYQPQADVREINLFYLGEQSRKRIERTVNGFKAGDLEFSQEEIELILENTPEKISPNVILRPLFQETILPDVAFIGGGGEMAYWIQLKGVFDVYKVVFPLLQQRISLHLIDGGMRKRLEKLPFDLYDYFSDKQELKNIFLKENNSEEIDFSTVEEDFNAFKSSFIEKTRLIDSQMISMVEAEFARISKQKDGLEQRLLKAVKQRQESSLSAIDFIVDRFIPENTLQERYFHWLNFIPSGDYSSFFTTLLDEIDPFESDLVILNLSE